VSQAAASWERLNPSWTIVRLNGTEASLAPLVSPDQLRAILRQKSPRFKSDLARTFVLQQNGGAYADADCFAGVPLDEWLPAAMGAAGFFAFRLENAVTAERRSPAGSWFLASAPKGEAFNILSERLLLDAWSKSVPSEHLEWHAQFDKLADGNACFRSLWDKVAHVYASHDENPASGADECELFLSHLPFSPPSGASSWLDAPDCVKVYSRKTGCNTVKALIDDGCGRV